MFEPFKSAIRAEVEEFLSTGKMQRAIELSAQTRQHFNHNEYPMYFTGRLDARLVLVHLNPKQKNNFAQAHTNPFRFEAIETYWEYHQHFGKNNYGPAAPRIHKSRFDPKQILFLKPFGIIQFVEEHTEDDRFTNLERVIDDKLQLELVPYGSDKVSIDGLTWTILKPHLERILDVISACPRDYVLFCGKIFETLLPPESITHSSTFTLTKKDGHPTEKQMGFSNLRFAYNGATIRAGLARSFALRGLQGQLMEQYGAECAKRYRLNQIKSFDDENGKRSASRVPRRPDVIQKRKETASGMPRKHYTFDVTIDGMVLENLPGPEAIFKLIQHLCDQGVSPEAVKEIVYWKRRLFLVEDGNLSSREFAEKARTDSERCFCGDGQLIRFNGKTYAVNRKWNARVSSAGQKLCAEFESKRVRWKKH